MSTKDQTLPEAFLLRAAMRGSTKKRRKNGENAMRITRRRIAGIRGTKRMIQKAISFLAVVHETEASGEG